MNFNDLGRRIDMLIGVVERDIHQRFQVRINEIITMYESLVAAHGEPEQLNRYNRLNKAIEQLEEDLNSEYSGLVTLITSAQALAFIHSFVGSAFLLGTLIGILPLIGFPRLPNLRVDLQQDNEEYILNNVLRQHRNQMMRDIRATLRTSVNEGVSTKDTKRRLKRISERYTKRAQEVASYEIGRAESQAEVEIGEKYDEAIDQLPDIARGFREYNTSKDNKKTHEKFRDAGSVLKRIWVSQRDMRVRTTHILLDGQHADEDNFFYSKPTASYGTAPRLMMGINAAAENIGCRCSVGYRVNNIELDYMEEDNMSADHQEAYEMTSYNEYLMFLEQNWDNIHPAYYKQLSKGLRWSQREAIRDGANEQNDLISDSKKFQKMLERGFHKKKNGRWGY